MIDLGNYVSAVIIITMIIGCVSLAIFISACVRSRRMLCNVAGAISLLVHMLVFGIFVVLAELHVFSIVYWLNDAVGIRIFSYDLWAAAILLQTAIDLFFMALTVHRRAAWINSVGRR